jgi:hypothetical protein
MDPIKEAFDKIKQDIFSLKLEVSNLNYKLEDLSQENRMLKDKMAVNFNQAIPTHIPTHNNPLVSTPTHIPTHQQSPQSLQDGDMTISTGNGGVPTDKPTNQQTNQQTNQHMDYENPNTQKIQFSKDVYISETKEDSHNPKEDSFGRASEILNSLDNLKKEIRLKFKRLTNQEMLVFSTLYSLEEQELEEITYKTLAHHLRLSESSIRDYVTKIASKGIPIVKIRLNNKKIVLKISPDLQKVASLSTILKLREL